VNALAALVVSGATGFVALSYEILWYRAYSIALLARPQAFGVVLGGYLAGIALGAYGAGRLSKRVPQPRQAVVLGTVLTAASLVGYLLIPTFAWFVTVSRNWAAAMGLLAVASCLLGAIFPLTAQFAIKPEACVGRWTSYLYLANILGSAAGSLFTGFWLMDVAGLPTLVTLVSMTGLALGTAVAARGGVRALTRVGTIAILGAALMLMGQAHLFAHLYDRLFFRLEFDGSPRFVEVVETRSGVIGVTADDAVYGAGVHDAPPPAARSRRTSPR
jgi:hypothetical protein